MEVVHAAQRQNQPVDSGGRQCHTTDLVGEIHIWTPLVQPKNLCKHHNFIFIFPRGVALLSNGSLLIPSITSLSITNYYCFRSGPPYRASPLATIYLRSKSAWQGHGESWLNSSVHSSTAVREWTDLLLCGLWIHWELLFLGHRSGEEAS